MTSHNEGNKSLVILGNDESSNDTTEFNSVIKQHFGHLEKVHIINLSDFKKGKFYLIYISIIIIINNYWYIHTFLNCLYTIMKKIVHLFYVLF